ncbi:MAG: hypothetical protein JZU55_12320, partial [Afipia sp.]|nr:hypothetical protein [Afipia sp.]
MARRVILAALILTFIHFGAAAQEPNYYAPIPGIRVAFNLDAVDRALRRYNGTTYRGNYEDNGALCFRPNVSFKFASSTVAANGYTGFLDLRRGGELYVTISAEAEAQA